MRKPEHPGPGHPPSEKYIYTAPVRFRPSVTSFITPIHSQTFDKTSFRNYHHDTTTPRLLA
ncbi:hypothetical protein PMIN06_003464 [Paraphaeosphaeria minitans]